MSKAEPTLIQRSYAIRSKYRINQELVRVAPGHIGFHPKNRGGQAPSSDRCQALVADILGKGFDGCEADTGGVLVQSAPDDNTQNSGSIRQFNLLATEGNEFMAYSVGGLTPTYGSLSHSHLNQAFKNIASGCKVNRESLTSAIADSSGRASLPMLEELSPDFAKYVRQGIKWEILSWKMDEEDPEAALITQAACNAKNEIGMAASEMEAIRALSSMCTRSQAVAGRIMYADVKQKMALTLRHVTDDPDFMQIFRFVVDLGGDEAGFIQDLSEFASKFVNSKARFLFD